jgi:hypothetical protein
MKMQVWAWMVKIAHMNSTPLGYIAMWHAGDVTPSTPAPSSQPPPLSQLGHTAGVLCIKIQMQVWAWMVKIARIDRTPRG